mmetsp:Transcript_16451/g.57499  ORF Transcript_16451/g.57499 Transcript_16451/m.57499 type:complete len:452 (-) Transcript_16451:5236-6591(-)
MAGVVAVVARHADRLDVAGQAEQHVAEQLHAALPDAPVVRVHALVERRQQRLGRRERVDVDDDLAGAHRDVAHHVAVVGEALHDQGQNGTDVRAEGLAHRARQERQHPQQPLARRRRRVRRERQQLREDLAQARLAQRDNDLAEALRTTRPLHGRRVGLQRVHQPRHEVAEVLLADAAGQRAKGARRDAADVRDRVEQRLLQLRHELVQVRQDVLLVLDERGHVAHDHRRLRLDRRLARRETAPQDRYDQRKRRRVDAMHESRVRQRIQRLAGAVRGVAQRAQQHRHELQDLWVADNAADVLQRLASSLLHARVRVAERLAQLRHNLRQARRQLARRAVRHLAQEHDAGLLGAPLDFLQALEQHRHHELNTVARQLAHDHLRSRRRGLAHLAHAVAVRLDEQRQDADHVRLEEQAKRAAQTLESEQCALASARVAAVARGHLEDVNDVVRL